MLLAGGHAGAVRIIDEDDWTAGICGAAPRDTNSSTSTPGSASSILLWLGGKRVEAAVKGVTAGWKGVSLRL